MLFEVHQVGLGVIHQVCGHNFAIFAPKPCVDSFYTMSVDKDRHFLQEYLGKIVELMETLIVGLFKR